MAGEEKTVEGKEPKKKSKKPLIIGLVLALVLGGTGFFAVWSGMVLGPKEEHAPMEEKTGLHSLPDVVFVPMEPLTISLGRRSNSRHLRFRAHLEVVRSAEAEVVGVLPRVVDVLNSYLRAIAVAELEDPTTLVRLRAQMLRRIQVVTGEGRVRDLLIMEFVLN